MSHHNGRIHKRIIEIQVKLSIASKQVLEALSELFVARGIPEFIRSDNGSEFIAENVRNSYTTSKQKRITSLPEAPGRTVSSRDLTEHCGMNC
jgi:hypothetical protein